MKDESCASIHCIGVSVLLLFAGTAHGPESISQARGGNAFTRMLLERGAGPEIGDYLGLPVNDAARLRADSWTAGKWTMLERQCEPHPADYAPRGPASMRISSIVDPVSQDVVSWQTTDDVDADRSAPSTWTAGLIPRQTRSTPGRASQPANGRGTC